MKTIYKNFIKEMKSENKNTGIDNFKNYLESKNIKLKNTTFLAFTLSKGIENAFKRI